MNLNCLYSSFFKIIKRYYFFLDMDSIPMRRISKKDETDILGSFLSLTYYEICEGVYLEIYQHPPLVPATCELDNVVLHSTGTVSKLSQIACLYASGVRAPL